MSIEIKIQNGVRFIKAKFVSFRNGKMYVTFQDGIISVY